MVRALPFLRILFLFCALAGSGAAFAQGTYFYAGGTGSNANPINTTGSTRCQWLYTSAEWNTPPPPGNITKVYFKVLTTAATSTFTNFTVRLSLPGVTTLPATAVPWLPTTTVYTAPTTVFTGVVSGGWISVVLQTPFFYPGNVPLLVDLSQTGYVNGLQTAQGTITGSQRRMYGVAANPNSTGSDGTLEGFGFDWMSPCTGTPTAPVITTAAITAPICLNATASISATNAGAPTGIAYQWEQASAAAGPWTSVSAGTGANTLNYTTGALTVTTFFRVKATCGTNVANSTTYEVPVIMAPGTITGNTPVCPNSSQTYSIPAITGATSYTWTKPTGWTGTSTTNSITLVSSATAGNITVTATSSCGTSVASSKAITISPLPSQTGVISGPSVFCNGATQQWTVPTATNATSYQWTLPTGWVFVGSSTGNTINATSNSTPGNITVAGVNACGNGPSSSLPVTFSSGSAVTPSASISTANTTVCSGVPVTFNAAIANGGPNPGYQWRRNGTPVSSNASYSSTGLANGDVISLTLNSSAACASPTVVNSSNSITLTVNPSAAAGININADEPNNKICAGTPVVFTANAAGTGPAPVYQWYRNAIAVGPNAPTLTIGNLANGDSVYCQLTSSNACPIGSPVKASNKIGVEVVQNVTPQVVIYVAPSGLVLPNTPLTFTASQVSGGTAPQYQWLKNGQVIFGANTDTYTTSNLKSGDEISLRMVSVASCANPAVVTSNKLGAQIATGIGGAGSLAGGLELSPNPNGGAFTVKARWDELLKGGSLELEVVNALGQTVHRVIAESPRTGEAVTVRMPATTPAGLYVLRVRTGSGQAVALRFEVKGE